MKLPEILEIGSHPMFFYGVSYTNRFTVIVVVTFFAIMHDWLLVMFVFHVKVEGFRFLASWSSLILSPPRLQVSGERFSSVQCPRFRALSLGHWALRFFLALFGYFFEERQPPPSYIGRCMNSERAERLPPPLP